jgi:lipopolysaccharide export system protein LptA
MRNPFLKLLVFLMLLCSTVQLTAQQNPVSPIVQSANGDMVEIIQAKIFRRIKRDSAAELNLLIGNVIMKQNNTMLYCDSAIQDMGINQVEAFGNIHINDADSVHTYAQYLKYLGNTKTAELKTKVKLTDGKGILTTEALVYDVNNRTGTYMNWGKVVNGSSVLTSKEGIYDASTRDVVFRKTVNLIDPDYKLSTDTLLYNVNTEMARFVSPTLINDGKSSIRTRSGFYDLKMDIAHFEQRPEIKDSTQTVIADTIDYDKRTGAGIARGNVYYSDSSQGVILNAGASDFNSDSKTVVAFKRPLMTLVQKQDSIFVSSDTLYSAYYTKDSSGKKTNADTLRYFKAYHDVKMFSDSLQGKCDSLFYSGADSIFRFFREPVMWTGGSQISGDTIFLHTKNRKPDQVVVNENAFSINVTREGFFNQLKGISMRGQFIDGEIDLLSTKGNSESVYYLVDEDTAYIGMNYAVADAINMKFTKRELKRVTWISGVTGTTYPFNQIPEEKKQLSDFRWLEAIRPKNVKDLLIKN